ncbi:MAG TPA: SagB/ThcOx family dehydrogenase [Candidatus Binatia bacterium]|nr:SagB/ThcOx family dehydrogenase [Candidatus Binatia bacterium]
MPNRDTAALRAYHEVTSHSVARLRQDPHWLDWDIMPRPFKVYPTLEPIPLPRDLTTAPLPALAALATTAASPGRPLDRAALAHLLYFSAGVLRRRAYPGGEIFFRAAACTGALYHVDLYLACGPLPDLDAGLYHFGPHDFALRRLRAGDHRAALVAASSDEPAVAAAPVVVAATSTFWRNAWKYRARAYRHAFWDTGTLLANLLAVAAAAGIAARVVLGFVDADVNRLLDVDGEHEAAIALVALGAGAPAPPPAPAAPPLGLDVLPYSPHEIAYPAISAAHTASALATPAEVAAWRAAPPPAPPARAAGPLVALPPPAAPPPEPIEHVIVRRGSARAFGHEPIALAELAALLRAATADVPIDASAPSTVYLVANAVADLDPGAYAHDPGRHGLERLRAGDFRRTAGHLGLGQDLPADAAANLFWLADLDAVLGRFGNRGYRAAQLAAAIAGGRVYLAAYALGLGATGLTFFDDDVTAFFSPHAAGRSVMFLVAVGHPARGGPRS